MNITTNQNDLIKQNGVLATNTLTELDGESNVSAGEVILEAASTLVWALPMPWGVFAATGLSVFRMLTGTESDSNFFSELITDMCDQIEQRMIDIEIKENLAIIQQFVNWLNTEMTSIKELEDDNVSNTYLLDYDGKKGIINQLRENAMESSQNNLYRSVHTIGNFVDNTDRFNIWMVSINTHLLALKMIVQLQAVVSSNYSTQAETAKKLAEDYTKQGKTADAAEQEKIMQDCLTKAEDYEKLWRESYLFYKHQIGSLTEQSGYVYTATEKLTTLRKNRFAEVKAVVRDKSKYLQEGEWWTWEDTNSNYKDEKSKDKNKLIDIFWIDGRDDYRKMFEYQYLAKVKRIQWMNEVNTKLNTTYGNQQKAIEKWTSLINDWNGHLVPLAPKSSPQIDSNGWQGKPPNDKNWLKTNFVSYTLSFYNECGESSKSDYCDPQAIQADKGCTLILPEDSTGWAQNAYIYRRITNKASEGDILQEKKIAKVSYAEKTKQLIYHDCGK